MLLVFNNSTMAAISSKLKAPYYRQTVALQMRSVAWHLAGGMEEHSRCLSNHASSKLQHPRATTCSELWTVWGGRDLLSVAQASGSITHEPIFKRGSYSPSPLSEPDPGDEMVLS